MLASTIVALVGQASQEPARQPEVLAEPLARSSQHVVHTPHFSEREHNNPTTDASRLFDTLQSISAALQTYPVAAHMVGADRVRGCPRSASQSQQHQAGCPHGQLMCDCALSLFLFFPIFPLRPFTTGTLPEALFILAQGVRGSDVKCVHAP